MQSLSIVKVSDTFVAGSSEGGDEMHNLSGSIFDMWCEARQLLKSDPEDEISFSFEEFFYQDSEYQADWNPDLCGYVLVFKDGKSAQTIIETNRLHADYNEEYLQRFTEFDDDLSDEQDKLADEFVTQINKIKYNFG